MLKLSIITINLNHAKGLQKTAESVAQQSFHGFEWIVVDGLSTDKSKEVIEKFSTIINRLICEKDSGIFEAMNKGIKIAQGEYCLFLNSGDYLLMPDSLEKLFSYSFNSDIIYFNKLTFAKREKSILKYPSTLNFSFMYHSVLCHQSSLIKKNLFQKIGFYNEKNKISSDHLFFLKAIFKNNCSYKYIDDEFTVFETSGVSTTQEAVGKNECKIFMEKEFSLFVKDMDDLELMREKNKSSIFKFANKIQHSNIWKTWSKWRTKLKK